jgi:hypothetical protein
MATVADLQAQLDGLRALRAGGEKRTKFRDRETEYRSDAELVAAIADIEKQIAALQGVRPIHTVRVSSSKGL